MHGPVLFYYMEIAEPCGCQSIPLTQTPKVATDPVRRAALCDSR